MRQASPRPWAALAFIAAVALGTVGSSGAAQAQDQGGPRLPIEPTGRAVCNAAFTMTSAVGLGSFVVPPDAPVGPNEVIVAMRPILDACVGLFTPSPQRQCVTSELYPDTGLPITLPDPLGILTEQVDALTDALAPLGIGSSSSPLSELFESVLECRDLPPVPDDEGGFTPVPELTTDGPTSTSTAPGTAADTVPDRAEEQIAAVIVRSDDPPGPSLLSNLPGPLRGAVAVAAVGFVAGCAFVFRGLMTPRRPLTLLDADPALRR